MKNFIILESPHTGDRKAVKDGWSWPAFFFNGIWLLVKRLWGYALFLLFCYFVLAFVSTYALQTYNKELFQAMGVVRTIFSVAVAIYLGVAGNSLYASHLKEKKGYVQLAVVEAPDPDTALARYHNDTAESVEEEAV